MPGYCGICNRNYEENGLDHIENCSGGDNWIESGSLEDYHQQTGDTGLIQAPHDFDWNDVLNHRR